MAAAAVSVSPTPSAHIPYDPSPMESLTLDNIPKFAGEFVVFLADDFYFDGEQPYRIDNTKNPRYGIIERKTTIDDNYSMVQLRKINQVATICLLTAPQLQEHPMLVRKATVEEVCSIREAIKYKQAEIEYDFFSGRIAPRGFHSPRDSFTRASARILNRRGDCSQDCIIL